MSCIVFEKYKKVENTKNMYWRMKFFHYLGAFVKVLDIVVPIAEEVESFVVLHGKVDKVCESFLAEFDDAVSPTKSLFRFCFNVLVHRYHHEVEDELDEVVLVNVLLVPASRIDGQSENLFLGVRLEDGEVVNDTSINVERSHVLELLKDEGKV